LKTRNATLVLLLVAGIAGIPSWLLVSASSEIVSPPRPKISRSSRPVLGLELRDEEGAVLVERSVPPASKAGLRPGDRILRLDERAVGSAEEVAKRVREAPAGHLFTIEASRNSGEEATAILLQVASESRPVSPGDFGLPFEEVTFTNRSGLALRGWYIPPPGGPGQRHPAVVYGHGNGQDRRSFLHVAPEVHEAGMGQLLFDFAGRGESDGQVITLGAKEASDLRAGLDWLEGRPEVDPERLALAGRSMGAAAAILAAAEDPRPKALVLDSPFADLVRVVDETIAARFRLPPFLLRTPLLALAGWRAGYDPWNVRPIEAIARVKIPILLFHGTKDEEVPPHHSESLRKAAGGPVRFIPLENSGHNSPRPASYRREIVCFLVEILEPGHLPCPDVSTPKGNSPNGRSKP